MPKLRSFDALSSIARQLTADGLSDPDDVAFTTEIDKRRSAFRAAVQSSTDDEVFYQLYESQSSILLADGLRDEIMADIRGRFECPDLEEYLQAFNDDFPHSDDIGKRFDAIIAFVRAMKLDGASRIWKQSDFFTAFAELDRVLHKEKQALDPQATAEALSEFYHQVDQPEGDRPDWAAAYHKAAIQAANDRSNRALRGELVRVALLDAVRATAR